MMVLLFQLLTIAALFAFIIHEWFVLHCSTTLDEKGEIAWELSAKRIRGTKSSLFMRMIHRQLSSSIALPEGSYMLGNGFWQDIFIHIAGPSFKAYLNVDKKKLYLTMIKGELFVNGQPVCADPGKRLLINESMHIRVSNVELSFYRRRKHENYKL